MASASQPWHAGGMSDPTPDNPLDASLPLVFVAYALPDGPKIVLGDAARGSMDNTVITLACTGIMVQRGWPSAFSSGVDVLRTAADWLANNPALHERRTESGVIIPSGMGTLS